MPSHLSTIGFPVSNADEVASLSRTLASDVESIRVRGGRYARWKGNDGEELWFQVDSRDRLVGLTPHFTGPARMRVGIVERVVRPGDTALDGAFRAWASPHDAEFESGDYPFVFDAPDAAAHVDVVIPSTAEAQIAAFAHEVACFDTEAAFHESQTDGLRFASRSFVPSGPFATGSEDASPTAEAHFTGRVIETRICTNSASGLPFRWALVDTLGGRYDVVIDSRLLRSEPIAGGWLSGAFWLSGRLLSTHTRARSRIARLFGPDR